MHKLINLKLLKIKYGGDSIGSDIRVEIECLGSSISFNKKIKNKSEVLIDKIVGQFSVNQSLFFLPLCQ